MGLKVCSHRITHYLFLLQSLSPSPVSWCGQPAVLDGGYEIILANWPNNKHIECNIRIPRFPYVLLKRSVLCNCEIEAKNHFHLESLAACQELESKLTVYCTVNLAFVNCFDNLTKSLEFLILLKRTTYKQILPFLQKHLILNQNY